MGLVGRISQLPVPAILHAAIFRAKLAELAYGQEIERRMADGDASWLDLVKLVEDADRAAGALLEEFHLGWSPEKDVVDAYNRLADLAIDAIRV